jgi:hypothetical protein
VAHHFDTASDPGVDAARLHERAHEMVGLLAGAALGIDGRGAARPSLVASEPGNARDVAGLLAGLGTP